MHFWLWLSLILVFGYFLGAWGSTIVFSVYLAYHIHQTFYKTKNWVNPIFLYQVSLLLATLANMKIIYLFESGVFLKSYRYAVPELFDEAALVWAVGNLFLMEGYRSIKYLRLPTLQWKLPGSNSIHMIFLISVVLIFRQSWLPFKLPGTLDSLIALFPLLGILLHARLAAVSNSKWIFYSGLLLTVLATGHAVLFSYLRINMVIPIIVFFIGTLAGTKNLNIFLAPRYYPLYGFIIVFLILFTSFGESRSTFSYGWDRIPDLVLLNSSVDNIDRADMPSAFERSSTIGQLSAVSGLVSEYGHYKGTASQPLLISLIPRFLWPEKPPIALGVWFALEIEEALPTAAGWYNTSINMTIPGHMFLDFGWLGLIFGSWLVGAFLKILWNASNFSLQLLNVPGAFFAMYLLYNCLLGFGADLQILITMLATYLMLLVVDRALQFFIPTNQRSALAPSPNQLGR